MKSAFFALALVSFSHSVFAQTAVDPVASKAAAETIILKSCGGCHDSTFEDAAFVDETGAVDFKVVAALSEAILARLASATRPMPPVRAPVSLQITEEERVELSGYVETLVAPAN